MKWLASRPLRVGTALAVGIAVCAVAPAGLRHLDAFRVRNVEVTGTWMLPPHEALAASGIDTLASVFDDFEAAVEALRSHPLVADVRIARKPPSTVVIHVEESEPIALIATPRLEAVDVRGRVLPLDPSRGELDVPVIGSKVKVESGEVTDGAVRAALLGLADVRAFEPILWGWISELHPRSEREMRLVLRWPGDAELLLGLPVSAARLEEVRLVLADLANVAAPGSAVGAQQNSELDRLRRLDARFDEQVIVSLAPAPRRATTRETR